MDLATARSSAIAPTPAFANLLRDAQINANRVELMLLSAEEVDEMNGLVEIGGLEPPTSSLRTTRSPN